MSNISEEKVDNFFSAVSAVIKACISVAKCVQSLKSEEHDRDGLAPLALCK